MFSKSKNQVTVRRWQKRQENDKSNSKRRSRSRLSNLHQWLRIQVGINLGVWTIKWRLKPQLHSRSDNFIIPYCFETQLVSSSGRCCEELRSSYNNPNKWDLHNSLLISENKNTASENTSRNTGSQLVTTSTHWWKEQLV